MRVSLRAPHAASKSPTTPWLGAFHSAFVATIALHSAGLAADPLDKTVRVPYIQPTDVAYNPKYVTSIASVMKSAQRYFMEQCKFTSKLSDPVVEVVKGTHPRSWYEANANDPDEYWWAMPSGFPMPRPPTGPSCPRPSTVGPGAASRPR